MIGFDFVVTGWRNFELYGLLDWTPCIGNLIEMIGFLFVVSRAYHIKKFFIQTDINLAFRPRLEILAPYLANYYVVK